MNANAMRWLGAAGITAIAVMRCCIVFTPQLVFDSDPVFDSGAPSTLGMAGSLFLDVALVIACVVAIVGEWRSKRGLDPVLLALALLPLPVVWWHGRDDAGDMWRGATWLAAALACVTVAHLSRERIMRIAVTAALIAVIVPLLARGAVQMTWEHDATVATYQQNKSAFLHARGWEPDSPAARIYERRLMHREPTGWFASTNIYGSVMGAAAIAFAGAAFIAFLAWRSRVMQSGVWFLMAMLALACAAAMVLTTSMGALLATMAGALVLAAVLWTSMRKDQQPADPGQARGYVTPGLGITMLILILGATFGVILRGALLPEGFVGEKSLLFRWHYLQAAVGVISEHPWLGVGPDGFQPAYTLHRPPRNPEEVQSAHAMFTDWIATLGIIGGAWVALIIALVVRSGHSSASTAPRNTSERRVALRFLIAVAALALVPAVVIEWPALADVDIFLRGLAAIGYIVVAVIVTGIMSITSERLLRGATAAAVTVLLVHGQIEMSFFQSGSVVWLMAMVGLAGAAIPVASATANRFTAVFASTAMLAFVGWMFMYGALPAMNQERTMLHATIPLESVRANPNDREVALRQRPVAADELVKAYNLWPINVQPLNAAADQLLLAADQPPAANDSSQTGPPLGLLMRAEEIIDRAVAEHGQSASIVLAMNIHAALAALTDDDDQWSRAIALGRQMTQRDPHGIGPWKRLGDVLWAAGARPEAAEAYQRALANSDNFALDELKQLGAESRAAIATRIAAAATSRPEGP